MCKCKFCIEYSINNDKTTICNNPYCLNYNEACVEQDEEPQSCNEKVNKED